MKEVDASTKMEKQPQRHMSTKTEKKGLIGQENMWSKVETHTQQQQKKKVWRDQNDNTIPQMTN